MAAVGFTLERMTHLRGLSKAAGAYVFAALLVAGPWIFTVLGLTGITASVCNGACPEDVRLFRSVVIYNSLFSLIVTSPIAFVCTRFIADRTFDKEFDSVTFAFAAGLAAFAAVVFATAVPFYGLATTLESAQKVASLHNLLLIGASWLLVPCLGAMKSFGTVSLAFAIGAAVMIGVVRLFPGTDPGFLLSAFNLGLGTTNAILVGTFVAEFGIALVPDKRLLATARKYWELPLIGVAYGLGLWGDKIVMWIAGPADSVTTAAGALRTMPDYDTPMFFAQLTAIPVLAVFFIHIETNFFLLCQRFYGRVTQHASRRELEQAIARLNRFVLTSVLGLFAGLAAIATLAVLGSFAVVDVLGLRVAQLGVLRAGLVGMVCHTSAMFCFIFLLYFDLRRPALIVALTFMVANASLTALMLPLGFAFYGYGNLLASGITLIVAMLLLVRELPWLHFHAFVTNNHSLREPPIA